jgi:ribose 5-phosphate isomerase B
LSTKGKIGIAADHAGKDLKQMVYDFLRLTEYEIVDYGVASDSETSVDYPDFAGLLASDLSTGKIERGIAICGTGIGMCITANKFPGVRAALVTDEFTARMSRAHNDANLMCLGSRVTNHHRAVAAVKVWLETEYERGRHELRLNKIREIEKRTFKPRL